MFAQPLVGRRHHQRTPFWIFPHLLQIVCVLVDVPELVNDNLLIDHLDVTTSKPIDKFSPFLVSFARACVILCIDALFVRGDFFLVTNETNPVLERSVRNMSWQRLNVAHVDELICVCLKVCVDTVAPTEPLGFGQLTRELKCDIDVRGTRLPFLACDPNSTAKITSV